MTAAVFANVTFSLPRRGLPPEHIFIALAVTAAFGLFGYFSRGVNESGAVTGGVLAFLLFMTGGSPAFIVLVGVFIMTWIATRIGYVRKAGLGLAENTKGRNARQVFANVGAAALFAVAGVFDPQLMIACAAALAEAAADTASSEVGEALGRRAYLITSLRRVDIGTDGGVSLPGTIAAAVATCLIAALAAGAGLIHARHATAVAIAGFLGTIAHSLLGATLERNGTLGNSGVNFASTFLAGMLALLLVRFG